MSLTKQLSRRRFIALAGAAGATGLAAAGCTDSGKPPGNTATAVEFLDREHGIFHRAIFILEEFRGGTDARMDLPPQLLQGAVDVLRRSVTDHHQKIEEKFIYSSLDAAGKLGGLVGVLREQHEAAARLSEILGRLAADFSAKDLEKRRTLGSAIHLFGRMYRAHVAREETVLFPAFRQALAPRAYEDVNSRFLAANTQAWGTDGFDETIRRLAEYESELGIGDLSAFTPRVDELS